MRFALTEHAKVVLLEREIDLDWVRRVVEAPEKVEPDVEDPDLEHRLGRIPQYGNRVLRVAVNPRARPLRVVTAYFDRTMRKKL